MIHTQQSKNRVNELDALKIMALGLVITSTRLAKNEFIGPKDMANGSKPNTTHGAKLQIHEHHLGHISSPVCFIVVHIDPLQLKIPTSIIPSSWINPMVITNDLPKLGSDLVFAPSCLYVQDLIHSCFTSHTTRALKNSN